MRRVYVSMIAAAVSMVVAACGSSSPPEGPVVSTPLPVVGVYPQAVQQSFLGGCEVHGTVTFCMCVLDRLETVVPLATIDSYVVGTFPQWLTDASSACLQPAVVQ